MNEDIDPGFVDALLQDLAVDGFAVGQQAGRIDRLVALADRREDPALPEQGFHAESAGFVGNDRNDVAAELGVAQQLGQDPDVGHRRRGDALARTGQKFPDEFIGRGPQRAGRDPALRDGAAELAPPLFHVDDFAAVGSRMVEIQIRCDLIGNRDLEAVAERQQLVGVQLLLLVGDVAALAGLAESVALDRPGQDHGWRAAIAHRLVVGGVDLDRIVTAQGQPPELVVALVGDQGRQLGVGVPEMRAQVGSVGDRVLLEVPVDYGAQASRDQAFLVTLEQFIPIRTPEHLDHVPASPAENGLQFLDDLGIPSDRAVQTLQIAVDYPDQVVEHRAGGQRNSGQALGFIDFAVADERPHLALGGCFQPAGLHVAHEAGLVDRHQRTQAHRDRRVVPEIGHQPGVRVGGQARLVLQFAPEIRQLRLVQAPLQEGPRIHPRGAVALEVDDVAPGGVVGTLEEVILGDFV